MSVYLNLVFHNIAKNESEIDSVYTISLDFYMRIKEEVLNLLSSINSHFDSVRFYFDDNYISFYDLILPLIKRTEGISYVVAVPTDFIDEDEYMSAKQLKELDEKNINISPHGVSHAALCIYSGDHLLPTNRGGRYINSKYGKSKSLTEEKVIYQLIESKRKLNDIGVNSTDEFVLPYGLYNQQTLEINESKEAYKYIATCDEYLDTGESLRPRFLIVNNTTIEGTLNNISKLETTI